MPPKQELASGKEKQQVFPFGGSETKLKNVLLIQPWRVIPHFNAENQNNESYSRMIWSQDEGTNKRVGR